MTLDQHLAHLTALLAPPYREAWRAYVWQRAQELATDPELADLPRLLTAEMKPSRAMPTTIAASP